MNIYPKAWRETKKYLTYGHLPSPGPGFTHQRSNLSTVCLEAVLTNRIPVLSKNFTLSAVHNPAGSVVSSWDRYWDISKTMVYIYRYYPLSKQMIYQATYPIPVLWSDDLDDYISKKSYKIISREILGNSDLDEYELIYRKPVSEWWSFDFPESSYNQSKQKITKEAFPLPRDKYQEKIFFHRKPSVEVWTVVNDIVEQLGRDFWAIHIRRNDMLNQPNSHSACASDMPWIITNLDCANLDKHTPVLLMTDERDPLYLLPLQKKFNIIRVSDFKLYQNIRDKYPDDNYLRFWIESLIFFHAKRRYQTAKYAGLGHGYKFMHFLKPKLEKINHLPSHHPLLAEDKLKYFSDFSLKKRDSFFNKYLKNKSLFSSSGYRFMERVVNKVLPFHPLRYKLAKNLFRLRFSLNRYIKKCRYINKKENS